MPRLTKKDRLAKIRQAATYPDRAAAIAAAAAARTAQSIARAMGEVPVAESAPKHLSAAYNRAHRRTFRYVSRISEQADIYLAEVARWQKTPRPLSPLYRPAVPAADRPSCDNGPVIEVHTGATRSRITLTAAAAAVTRSANLAAATAIVATHRLFPPPPRSEAAAQLAWAQDVLYPTAPARISTGAAAIRHIAEAERLQAIRVIAQQERETARERATLSDTLIGPADSPTRYWARGRVSRPVPLHQLVPLAQRVMTAGA